jgi:hypothetical protein
MLQFHATSIIPLKPRSTLREHCTWRPGDLRCPKYWGARAGHHGAEKEVSAEPDVCGMVSARASPPAGGQPWAEHPLNGRGLSKSSMGILHPANVLGIISDDRGLA